MSPLMEQWVQPGQGDGYGRRIGADGSVEECTPVTASYEGGELVFGSQSPEWRAVGRLEPAVQRMLEDAIRSAGILDLARAPALPGTTVAKAKLTWTVALDGRSNELELSDAHLLTDPALAAVDQAFQLAFGHATAAR